MTPKKVCKNCGLENEYNQVSDFCSDACFDEHLEEDEKNQLENLKPIRRPFVSGNQYYQ